MCDIVTAAIAILGFSRRCACFFVAGRCRDCGDVHGHLPEGRLADQEEMSNATTYTAEFKAEAVKLVAEQGWSHQQAAQRLGTPKGSLGN